MPKKTFFQQRAIEAAKAEAAKNPDAPAIAEPLEHGFGSRRNGGFADNAHRQIVAIHHYSPVDEIVARACGLVYGQVYVGGCGEETRSHEISEKRNSQAFIPREQVQGELVARRIRKELALAERE